MCGIDGSQQCFSLFVSQVPAVITRGMSLPAGTLSRSAYQLAFTRYFHAQYSMVYGIQTGGRR